MKFDRVGFRRNELGKTFAASDISSVIALAKSENGRESTRADAGIRKRQIDGAVRLQRKALSLLGFLKTAGKNPCLPAKFETRVASCYNSCIFKRFRPAASAR